MWRRPDFFEFTSYEFSPTQKRAVFHYRTVFTDGTEVACAETLLLPRVVAIKNIPKDLLENALTSVHLALGISYYKMFAAPRVHYIKSFPRAMADFWTIVYKKGLGEFWYRNHLNPAHSPRFPFDASLHSTPVRFTCKDRALVGIGGGKDSIVLAEMFKEAKYSVTSFVVETQRESELVNDVVQQIGAPILIVRRILDEKLFDSSLAFYNGHIPVSMIYAALGMLAAICYDYSYIAVGNARSSDYGNGTYKNMNINHQWSKSEEFEALFQAYTRNVLTPDIIYFSPLRAFYEIRVAGMLVKHKAYLPHFSSCNRNFQVRRTNACKWCGECPKCAYTFLLFAAFLPQKKLLQIFGKNLLAQKTLIPLYKDILGFGDGKPFDCVGRFEETQAALYLASKRFPDVPVVQSFLPRIKNPSSLIDLTMKTSDAPYTPARFRFMGMRAVLIIGYGREGRATHTYLKEHVAGVRIGIADRMHGAGYLTLQEKYDIAVKTPGIPRRLITIPYTTATNIFFSHVRDAYVTVGVTGSKGKSTTASLLYAMLKEEKKHTRLLGNVGVPMLSMQGKLRRDEILVLELSSYQLEDMRSSPHIAVVTNLFPDHMDYHGDVEAYFAAKKNITMFQTAGDFFVYNQRSKLLRAWAAEAISMPVPFADDMVLRDAETLLLGEHNKENIRAAASAARILGVPDAAIWHAIKKFVPLPHRLERVDTFRGILFYDDAISTTPESTIAALRALPRVDTILLGGQDRGYDFSALERELRRKYVKNIVLFPDSGKRILSSSRGFLHILKTKDMKEAVGFCYAHTAAGGICLLSTASPSYSVWKNFEEKGGEFQKWVRWYGKRKTRSSSNLQHVVQ